MPPQRTAFTIGVMERAAALAHLPSLLAVAMVLDEAGLDDEAIGTRLGIEQDAVSPLVRIAQQKYHALAMRTRNEPTGRRDA